MMTAKALVCGAGGFIGGHLVKKLKAAGYWVRGVDIKEHEFAPTQADDFLLLDLREEQNCQAALTLPDGTFEQDSERVLRSSGWIDTIDANASGGSYYRDTAAIAWFPFSGDSFTYHAIHRSSAGWNKVYVDGEYLTTLYLYNPDVITRTYSFDGFGPGPHIVQISGYRSTHTVDAFTTPGTAPFYDTNPSDAYIRFEEDHTNWLYIHLILVHNLL